MKGILKMQFGGCLKEGVLMIDNYVVQYDQWYQILPMMGREATYKINNGFAVIQSF